MPGRKSIVVSISEQTLTAYQGDQIILETLVSTGVDPNDTEVGSFHVRIKFPMKDMTGVTDGSGRGDRRGRCHADRRAAASRIPGHDVPDVMFINFEAEALHGAYWHNNFGQRMSHGCINLPLDVSAFLFDWAPLGTAVTVYGSAHHATIVAFCQGQNAVDRRPTSPETSCQTRQSPEPDPWHQRSLRQSEGRRGQNHHQRSTPAVLAGAIGTRSAAVDLDPQGNARHRWGRQGGLAHDHDALIGESLVAGIVPLFDRTSTSCPPPRPLPRPKSIWSRFVHRERQLKRALAGVADRYDLAIIDCPPSLGLLTVNGLTAADHVVMPIQCEFLALEGVSQLITTIDLVKRQLNPHLDLLGVLMTMFDARTNLSASVVEEVRRFFPDRIFDTIIPRSVRLAEAPSYGQSIAEYDPSSRGGGVAYAGLCQELIERLGSCGRIRASGRASPLPAHRAPRAHPSRSPGAL